MLENEGLVKRNQELIVEVRSTIAFAYDYGDI